jgi:signal transduction histidine kinase
MLLTYWHAYKTTTSPIEKNRIKYVFLAYGIYCLGVLDWLPAWGIGLYPFSALFAITFDAIMAYTIVSQKLFDIKTLALRTAMWLATSLAALVPLCGILWFLNGWINQLPKVGLVFFFLALFVLFAFYWTAVQARVDQIFQKRRYDLKQVLTDYVAEMGALKNLREVQAQLKKMLTSRLYVETVSLFVEDEGHGRFIEITSKDTTASRVANFKKDNPFIAWLQLKNEVVPTDEILLFVKDAAYILKNLSEDLLTSALDFIAVNNSPYLIVPLTTQSGLVGWIALSGRIDGRAYSHAELEFLDQLRQSLAIAISNAMLYDQVKQFNTNLEVTVAARTQELRQANDRLKQLDVAKTEFLAMANHELRHPLSSVRGFADMLSLMWDKFNDDKKKELVAVIQESSAQMLGLITDFLDVSKIELGKLDLSKKLTPMSDLVEKVAKQLRVQHKGLKFSVDVDSDVTLNIDPDKIQQVLMNLAGNAVKYSPNKGTVKITGQKADGQFLMAVEDEGRGIPPEHLGKLFQKFYRIETADPQIRKGSQVKGSGLGLTIAKSIVEMHGGKIWAENREDEAGACFCFTLPLS